MKSSLAGSHSDDAFALNIVEESTTTWSQPSNGSSSIVYDTERRADVQHFTKSVSDSEAFWKSGFHQFEERAVSYWARNDHTSAYMVGFEVVTNAGIRHVQFFSNSGTDSVSGSYAFLRLNLPQGEWHRVEADLAAIVADMFSETYQSIRRIYAKGRDFRLHEIRLSNAVTEKRNSLMPGSVGQIAYTESWIATVAPFFGGVAKGSGERKWLYYNHVGNVASWATETTGGSIHTDAFGNPLASPYTGA